MRRTREIEVMIPVERDPEGGLVWVKSSLLIEDSDEQRAAFEAAKEVLARKKGLAPSVPSP